MTDREALQLRESIQEQISIVAELWDWSDFEETALCQLVCDCFEDFNITNEQVLVK
jgi:hypothetical protein